MQFPVGVGLFSCYQGSTLTRLHTSIINSKNSIVYRNQFVN
jgi:hypothetical protein